jgi:hypothetical protein
MVSLTKKPPRPPAPPFFALCTEFAQENKHANGWANKWATGWRQTQNDANQASPDTCLLATAVVAQNAAPGSNALLLAVVASVPTRVWTLSTPNPS